MPRSDVGQIFRGQVIQGGRGGALWVKSYVFATPDGQVGISCAAPPGADQRGFQRAGEGPGRCDFRL